jgi:serine/threonine protein kinase
MEPTTVTHAEDGPPKIVAGHELRGELARGGLGVIYLAWHPLLNDLRAIKRPLAHGDPDIVLARFRREVRAVGALRHDHIIRAHDAGADGDGPYLVTEYLDGEPLSQLLKRHRSLPVAEVCELIRQAALGLQAAHERGLVHRDVKPSNLMLARANAGARVVVIDWGLVKWMSQAGPAASPPDDGLTDSGAAMGTLDYMAPEQARGARTVDIRADIYSLGVTLYCLLAGKPPFHNRSHLDKLVAHDRETFPPLEQRRSDIPAGLLAVLAKMVAKDSARRYATPGETAEALRPFCAGAESRLLALLGGRQPPPLPPPRRRRLGRMATILVLGAVLLGGVALALVLMKRGKTLPGRSELGTNAAILGEEPAEPVSVGRHPGHCSSLVFTPDGRYAVSESGGGGFYVWDLQQRKLEGRHLHSLEQPERNQQSSGVVAVSPDGSIIAAAGLNNATDYMILLSLFDRKTRERTGVDVAYGNMSRALAFSPDSSHLATAERPLLSWLGKPSIRILDVRKGTWEAMPCRSSILSLAYSPDGKALAAGGEDKSLRLWLVEPKRAEHEFTGHAGPVDRVAFSADGKRIFSASSADGTLRLWDNDKDVGKKINQISMGADTAKMACSALWPGGRALTGHLDGSIALWDLETGQELKRFAHKGVAVTAVAISPDGQRAVAALSDRLVYLYPLPPPAKP